MRDLPGVVVLLVLRVRLRQGVGGELEPDLHQEDGHQRQLQRPVVAGHLGREDLQLVEADIGRRDHREYRLFPRLGLGHKCFYQLKFINLNCVAVS